MVTQGIARPVPVSPPLWDQADTLEQPLDHADTLTQALMAFAPISLAQMESVALLNRTDSKYVFSVAQLGMVLPMLAAAYRVLEIDGRRAHRYHTLYFDTADFTLYRRHHAGGRNRYKVRSRAYRDTGLTFLEVKHKVNRDRTIKHRLPTRCFLTDIGPAASMFLGGVQPVDPQALTSRLTNDFRRITLVSIADQERVTLDLDVQFQAGAHRVALPGVVIAEVKQTSINRRSPCMQAIRRLHIQQTGLSKYCTGAALLYPDLPRNNLKPLLMQMQKLMEIPV